jgi:hypothetical protein
MDQEFLRIYVLLSFKATTSKFQVDHYLTLKKDAMGFELRASVLLGRHSTT